MENKNLAPHEPVVREGDSTPYNATAARSAAYERRYATPDLTYITAALSYYDAGPAHDDVNGAWDRILAERAELVAALRETLEMGEMFIPAKLEAPGFMRARVALSKATTGWQPTGDGQ